MSVFKACFGLGLKVRSVRSGTFRIVTFAAEHSFC